MSPGLGLPCEYGDRYGYPVGNRRSWHCLQNVISLSIRILTERRLGGYPEITDSKNDRSKSNITISARLYYIGRTKRLDFVHWCHTEATWPLPEEERIINTDWSKHFQNWVQSSRERPGKPERELANSRQTTHHLLTNPRRRGAPKNSSPPQVSIGPYLQVTKYTTTHTMRYIFVHSSINPDHRSLRNTVTLTLSVLPTDFGVVLDRWTEPWRTKLQM